MPFFNLGLKNRWLFNELYFNEPSVISLSFENILFWSQHSHVCTRASVCLQLSRVATQALCWCGGSLFLGLTCRHSNIERQLQTGPQSLGNGAGQMVISRVCMKVNQLPVSFPLQSISVPFNQQWAEWRESHTAIKPAPPRMRADHQERKAQKNAHNTHTHRLRYNLSQRREQRECVKEVQREAELLLWKKKKKKNPCKKNEIWSEVWPLLTYRYKMCNKIIRYVRGEDEELLTQHSFSSKFVKCHKS